ncbi:DNA resolvase [Burkholderia ubonensis]|uniref:recombinase family protein n=1 Tax=Burkholderia ubonensis TaxID=101571 RepID=UPI00075ACFD3|nr:recombinase family protein [Burkholderia ubonensis]KVU28431.1 DNA resolvase [Burkholderia ubonensis]
MKIGYARVSTEEQHLDLQLLALQQYQCDKIFTDQGISGARFDRPGLTAALSALDEGATLIVWRLDRLGRSLGHLVSVVADLSIRNVRIVSLTEGIDTQSSTGRFTFHLLAALAEFERSLISERTRAGVAAARARGRYAGRPRALSAEQLGLARELRKSRTESDVAGMFGVHPRTLRRLLSCSEEAPHP